MSNLLTIVIATRNDPMLRATITSLDYRAPIIVVDDASDKPIGDNQTGGWEGLRVIRNESRLGPGPSRNLGAMAVLEGWIMFCDSHMVFPKGWYAQAETYLLASRNEEIWGPVYHSDIIFDSFWHDSHRIAGADFFFWRHNIETGKFSFMDLLPRRVQSGFSFHVPCLLGGCYFVHSSWFDKMQGYNALIGYGCEEQWLSLSTWLMGGAVNIMGHLEVTHLFQKVTNTKRPFIPEWESNRIAVLKRILTPDRFEDFLSWLPIAQTTKDEVDSRCGWISRTGDIATIDNVTRVFGLQKFDEAMELMQQHKKDFCP